MRFPFFILAIILPLMACQSSPEPHYYTLSALSGTPLPGKKLIIKVQRPGIDSTLDRPQLFRQGHDMQIHYDNMALWSEPLDKMIERVVADNLEQRLPGSSVITESGGIIARPDYVVDLEVRQFGMNNKNQAFIDAVLLIHKPNSSGKPKPGELTQAAPGSNHSEVNALSGLLAALSDRIAHDIRQ